MKAACRLITGLILFAGWLSADTTETLYFRASLSPANEVPPVVGVTASGQATITLAIQRSDSGSIVASTVYFDVDYSFAEAVSVDGLHIHQGAAGIVGVILIDSGIRSSTAVSAQGTGNIFRPVNVVSGPALEAVSGIIASPANYYVNLHTSAHPDGLIRGQMQASTAPPPSLAEGAMVNSASFALHPAPLAPGSIAAIFGKYLNDGAPVLSSSFGPDGKLVTTLGGTQVRINGVAVPLFFSTFTLVALQIPTELAGATSATVQVILGGRTSLTRTIFIDSAAPGIFTVNASGQGPGAITHVDGSLVTPQNPALPNEIIVVYGTGLGQTDPPLASGAPAALNRVPTPTVTIDGVAATVEFAGRTPGLVGLDQMNVRVPASMREGSGLDMLVNVSGKQSNRVTMAVQSSSPPAANNPVPAITSLTPSSAETGNPALTLTINGNGFVQASAVTFNGVQKSVTFVNETRLTIPLTAADLAVARTNILVVTNPPPGGGTSNAFSFPVTAPRPPDPYDY